MFSDKYLISNLRFLKNEKHLYLSGTFLDIFTDTNLTEYTKAINCSHLTQLPFKLNTSGFLKSITIEDNNNKFKISLDKFLNAMFFKHLINNSSEDNILKDSHCFGEYVLGRIGGNLKNYFRSKLPKEFNLFDGYLLTEIITDSYNFYSINNLLNSKFYHNNNFSLDYSRSLLDLNNFLETIKFNVNKNNVVQCGMTGLYFHKFNCLSFYDSVIDDSINFNTALKILESPKYNLIKFFNLTNKIKYIHKYYVENISGQAISNIGGTCLRVINSIKTVNQLPTIRYIPELKTALFSDDKYFKDKNYLSKFSSAKNKLRDYSDNVLNVLDTVVLPTENKATAQTYGLEIECYSLPKAPINIKELIEEKYLLGTAICKSDGSIGHNGIEIVTVPMSFEYIKKTDYFFNFYKNVEGALGSFSRNSTGVHIHIGRKFLTTLQQAKIVDFINNSMNFDYLIKIAGRDFVNDNSNTYARPLFKDFSIKDVADYIKSRSSSDKYNAVNINHRETIEIRIFKGNVKPEVLYRYIEFTDALVNFVKNVSLETNQYFKFIEFVESHKAVYPILYEFNKFNFSKSKSSTGEIKYKTSFSKGYIKLLESRNIKYKPTQFKFVSEVKLNKVRKARNA